MHNSGMNLDLACTWTSTRLSVSNLLRIQTKINMCCLRHDVGYVLAGGGLSGGARAAGAISTLVPRLAGASSAPFLDDHSPAGEAACRCSEAVPGWGLVRAVPRRPLARRGGHAWLRPGGRARAPQGAAQVAPTHTRRLWLARRWGCASPGRRTSRPSAPPGASFARRRG
jgi:hypothetical protein